jgi:Insertion element 4 transposase N-terminal
MAGAPAGLPAGIRLGDHISLGVIARTFPLDRVQQILADTGKASHRERDLPARVMVYYAMALALYMGSSTREVLRCLLEGLRWLWGAKAVRVAGKSGISQARTRLGAEPLRRLYERVVRPGGDVCHARGLVPGVAPGQLGRLLPRCGRHRGELPCLRAPGGQPRRERLPPSSQACPA